MSIKTVQMEINSALKKNRIIKSDAKRIVEAATHAPTGRQTPVTIGEYRLIENFERELEGSSYGWGGSMDIGHKHTTAALRVINEFLGTYKHISDSSPKKRIIRRRPSN